VNGPYSLIITAVSSELALKVESKNAVATVVSIIVGTGSIGGAIGPALSGIVSQRGWDKVFYMIMLADFLALLSLVRVGLNDFKRLQNKFSSGK
jgi:OPA family glycerol-3-phosphate transporter-like MFS transporter 1/2